MAEFMDVPVRRRTVAKGVAWTVPAVAVASTAPAFALSGTPPIICAGVACKLPGSSCDNFVAGLDGTKGFAFPFTIENTDSKPIYIYSVTIAPFADKTFDVVGVSFPFGPIAAGAFLEVTVYANGSSSDQTGGVTTVTVEWGHTPLAADDTEHEAIAVPIAVPRFGVCSVNWSLPSGGGTGWSGANTCDPDFYDNPLVGCSS